MILEGTVSLLTDASNVISWWLAVPVVIRRSLVGHTRVFHVYFHFLATLVLSCLGVSRLGLGSVGSAQLALPSLDLSWLELAWLSDLGRGAQICSCQSRHMTLLLF